MSAPPAPNWLVKALAPFAEKLDNSDDEHDLLFAVWDAVLAEGTDCQFMPAEKYTDENSLETHEPGFPHGYLGPNDDSIPWRAGFLRVLVVPLVEGEAKPHA